MKRSTVLGVVLGLVAALALVVVVLANPCPPPPEPVCPEGQITVTPAVLVPEVPGYTEHRHYIDAVMGCPTDISAYIYHNASHHDCRWSVKIHGQWHYADEIVVTPAHWSAWAPGTCRYHEHDCEERDVAPVPGYWIPPVCRVPIAGCMDPVAINYNPAAEVDDGSCQYPPEPVPGCMDPAALNFNPAATVDDGSCQYPPEPIPGCTNESAINYNPEATVDDGTCEYPPEVIPGCTDPLALNYNPEANQDDGTCGYPTREPDCSARIWVWDLLGQDGIWRHLRDLGYDGTYDSPSVIQQCYYFGCDFHPVTVWGHYVTECDRDYMYWFGLPRYSGGGQCALP